MYWEELRRSAAPSSPPWESHTSNISFSRAVKYFFSIPFIQLPKRYYNLLLFENIHFSPFFLHISLDQLKTEEGKKNFLKGFHLLTLIYLFHPETPPSPVLRRSLLLSPALQKVKLGHSQEKGELLPRFPADQAREVPSLKSLSNVLAYTKYQNLQNSLFFPRPQFQFK